MLFYDVFVYLFPLNVCSYLSVNSFWAMKNSTLSVSASGGLSYQLASFSLWCSWTRKPYFRVSMLTPNKIINIFRGKHLIFFFGWRAAWSPACKMHPLLRCPPLSLTSCALGQRFLWAGLSVDVLTFCQTGFVFLKSVKISSSEMALLLVSSLLLILSLENSFLSFRKDLGKEGRQILGLRSPSWNRSLWSVTWAVHSVHSDSVTSRLWLWRLYNFSQSHYMKEKKKKTRKTKTQNRCFWWRTLPSRKLFILSFHLVVLFCRWHSRSSVNICWAHKWMSEQMND